MLTPEILLESAKRLIMAPDFGDEFHYKGYVEEVRVRYLAALATVEFEKDLLKDYAHLFNTQKGD